jgi:aminoglycoside phosphotransferase (APT) family kinase protein
MDQRNPVAEVVIDAELVSTLVQAQHPDLAGALTLGDEGWDNVTYRLRRHLAVRLPRRQAAVPLLENEQRWLPVVADRVGLAVPRPVRIGQASRRFTWPWSIVEWIEGETADREVPADSEAAALAAALGAIHRLTPGDAPSNPYRGVPLLARRFAVEDRLARLGLTDLEPTWRAALRATVADQRVLIHGDLHARNVVVAEGHIAGLIDWGDVCLGDRATDLACAWSLFDDAEARQAFLDGCGATVADRARAAGWAVNFASALIDSGEPRHVPMGRAIRRRLVTDALG